MILYDANGRKIGYNFRTEVFLQDDFLNESTNSGSIGDLNFSTLQGTTTVPIPEVNHPGIVRRATGASAGTVSTLKLGTSEASFIPSDGHMVMWLVRLNTNDSDTVVRIGSFPNSVADPFTDGIYFEKLLADTQWNIVARASSSETRINTGIDVSTNWALFSYIRTQMGVLFSINNTPVGSLITTTIPTVRIHPGTMISNGAAASKTIDHDFFQFSMFNLTR